jgi:hypothetical protein
MLLLASWQPTYPLCSGTTSTISVAAAAAASVDAPLVATIHALDQYGNLVEDATDSITLGITDVSGNVSTSVVLSQGVGTYQHQVTQPQVVRFTVVNSGSQGFTVNDFAESLVSPGWFTRGKIKFHITDSAVQERQRILSLGLCKMAWWETQPHRAP